MTATTRFPALPSHLSGTRAKGWTENQRVMQYELGSHLNFNYLIIDSKAQEAAWVDPQTDIEGPIEDLTRAGVRLSRILLTHTHFDHIPGVPALVGRFEDLTIHVHPEEQHRLRSWPEAVRARIRDIGEGDRLTVGGLEIRILHTPGHTAGECCFLLPPGDGHPPYLFTGDTVFIRDCGRTDLPTGSTAQMFSSLNRLKKLAGETVILPGHHYAPETASTLQREIAESGPFRARTVEDLAALP